MKIVSYVPKGINANGKQIVEAVIVSNTTPATLPTTGEYVDGMRSDDVFAPMSILYVTGNVSDKVYIANEDGTFIAQ